MNPTGIAGWQAANGFTLLELVLVMLLMGLSIGLILPRMGAGVKRMEEREFLQDLVQTLKRAHIRAMSSGQTAVFRIRGSSRRFGLERPPTHLIPDNVDIYSDILEEDPETGDRVVFFYSDGSVSDNDLKVVFNKQHTFFVFIHPISATIRVVERKSS
ncbi:MAG TPA: hypothetical protein DCZ69_05135 [Syntrophobacteraceae bacterium]|nr:hypothetical protein [Syntrophobacteraceae bacterium]HBD07624.1 hypothetical protein [Syntrophobacteraceae bacterium]HBZ57113.1 hypothetical protein [Syntrophobacteraceae bacterium]